MKIAITDANIFIDLYELGRLDWLILLDLEVYTTDIVLNELSTVQAEAARQVIAVVDALSLDEVSKLSLLQLPRGLSEADQSVIWQTRQLPDIPFFILTGDNLMRKWCTKNKMEVHGILWILDNLIAQKHLSKREALVAISRLMEINQWLPILECERRITAWKEG
jgi:hypothetical protein